MKASMLEAARVGDTIHVTNKPGFLTKKIEAGLNGGETVTQDGRTFWREFHPVTDFNKTGSDMFVWDKSGNKAKHEIVTVTRSEGGAITRTVTGTCFRAIDL